MLNFRGKYFHFVFIFTQYFLPFYDKVRIYMNFLPDWLNLSFTTWILNFKGNVGNDRDRLNTVYQNWPCWQAEWNSDLFMISNKFANYFLPFLCSVSVRVSKFPFHTRFWHCLLQSSVFHINFDQGPNQTDLSRHNTFHGHQ